jgi:hypothetical protein
VHIARVVGGFALLVTGGIHSEQYTVTHFSVMPTIGSLFLLNLIAVTLLGLVLLMPIRASTRRGRVMLSSMAALAGMGLAARALASLLISEHSPLSGFMQHGYRLEIVIAIVAEAVAIVSLGVFLALAESWAPTPIQTRDGDRQRACTPAASEA